MPNVGALVSRLHSLLTQELGEFSSAVLGAAPARAVPRLNLETGLSGALSGHLSHFATKTLIRLIIKKSIKYR
jgi:hypothetical protein